MLKDDALVLEETTEATATEGSQENMGGAVEMGVKTWGSKVNGVVMSADGRHFYVWRSDGATAATVSTMHNRPNYYNF